MARRKEMELSGPKSAMKPDSFTQNPVSFSWIPFVRTKPASFTVCAINVKNAPKVIDKYIVKDLKLLISNNSQVLSGSDEEKLGYG